MVATMRMMFIAVLWLTKPNAETATANHERLLFVASGMVSRGQVFIFVAERWVTRIP